MCQTLKEWCNPAQTPLDVDYDIEIPQKKQYKIDFSGNEFSAENFPFSVWTKISREVMTEKKRRINECCACMWGK